MLLVDLIEVCLTTNSWWILKFGFLAVFLLFISVPSQVIVGRTISKKNMLMSVCTKIGIQLNCKLGGEAWAVEIPVC